MRIFKAAFLALAMLALTVPALAGEIRDVRYWAGPEYTRIVVETSGEVNFTVNRIKSPERLYIDLDSVRLAQGALTPHDTKGVAVENIRSGQYNATTARVVIDLKGSEEYKVFRLSGPDRIVLDLYPSGAAPQQPTDAAPAAQLPAPPTQQVQQAQAPEEPKRRALAPDVTQSAETPKHRGRRSEAPVASAPLQPLKLYRVVLDAGHGGKDPGAIGLGGIREKDIVLDIVRRVKRILEEDGSFEVHMTRTRDIFLALDQRTEYANRRDADLFVAVHANSNPDRRVRGIETYLLNWTDDEGAMKVAARENNISVKRMKQTRDEVDVILASLTLQNKRDESLRLANYVQDRMCVTASSSYPDVSDSGVKQALFYVLFGANMPSVLVESGYLTNPQEARLLNTPVYRENLARGIAEGIKTYFKQSKGVQRTAMNTIPQGNGIMR